MRTRTQHTLKPPTCLLPRHSSSSNSSNSNSRSRISIRSHRLSRSTITSPPTKPPPSSPCRLPLLLPSLSYSRPPSRWVATCVHGSASRVYDIYPCGHPSLDIFPRLIPPGHSPHQDISPSTYCSLDIFLSNNSPLDLFPPRTFSSPYISLLDTSSPIYFFRTFSPSENFSPDLLLWTFFPSEHFSPYLLPRGHFPPQTLYFAPQQFPPLGHFPCLYLFITNFRTHQP